MDPIYSNCNKAMTNYTARVFTSAHELKHFNNAIKSTGNKASVKVEVLKEKVIQPDIEPVEPVVLEVVTEETTVVETSAVVESEVKDQEAPKKKRTAKKKKAAAEE